ncbi:DUF6306 domain-containing protein [Novosphingobium sp. BL-8H]|uniref:DUF6306 domain-containing protein n=1 Tax=Novosphingobium sp. BL-8H TaxID=3127640 RepID=UPI0037579227
MTTEPSSPVCYGADADDVYMGYAGLDEILTSLGELLEAERAGAKVALASTRLDAAATYLSLMRRVHSDEAKWCAMLSAQIRRLGGVPSRKTGAFREKALAITDPAKRLAFLNRGQGWVVRKLEALLPRIREEGLHRDLREMLDSHRANIAQAEAELDSSVRDA